MFLCKIIYLLYLVEMWYFYELSNIENPDLDKYRGCTDNIYRRMQAHKQSVHNHRNREYNSKKSIYIRDNGGWDKWQYKIIEEAKEEFMDKVQAKWRERYLITSGQCKLNTIMPILTREEKFEKRREAGKMKTERYRSDETYREKIKLYNKLRYNTMDDYRENKIWLAKQKYWAKKLETPEN